MEVATEEGVCFRERQDQISRTAWQASAPRIAQFAAEDISETGVLDFLRAVLHDWDSSREVEVDGGHALVIAVQAFLDGKHNEAVCVTRGYIKQLVVF